MSKEQAIAEPSLVRNKNRHKESVTVSAAGTRKSAGETPYLGTSNQSPFPR